MIIRTKSVIACAGVRQMKSRCKAVRRKLVHQPPSHPPMLRKAVHENDRLAMAHFDDMEVNVANRARAVMKAVSALPTLL